MTVLAGPFGGEEVGVRVVALGMGCFVEERGGWGSVGSAVLLGGCWGWDGMS